MKNLKILSVCLFICTNLLAQNQSITLEDIWSGEFSQEGLQSLQSLNDGQSYIVQDYNRDKMKCEWIFSTTKPAKKLVSLSIVVK